MAAEETFPVRASRGGGVYVSELQRGRLLSATFALVGERGFEGVSARRVSERAGVSNRTFYEFFSDREDCFLAAFNHAVDGLEAVVRAAWESEREWTARVRGALGVLLETLDREPAVRRLVFVEALAAGPRVLARRGRVLEGLVIVIDEGRAGAKAPHGLPPLTAEGVVGATFGVIHARLLEPRPEPLIELLGGLTATIVLPYRGSAAAARELARPAPESPARARRGGLSGRALGSASPVDYRLTLRTQMALVAVAGCPGVNNREVSEIIGLSDQGQISRMMKRLQEQGLVENTQNNSKRLARAWRLTADGEAVLDAHRSARDLLKVRRGTSKGGKLVAKHGTPKHKIASVGAELATVGFRMTARTHLVLSAVANLSQQRVNPSNLRVAQAAGVKDQGQISKLLARLEGHGMLENTGGPTAGANAWRLTPRGEELLHASSPSPAAHALGRPAPKLSPSTQVKTKERHTSE
jgi:AcrR family transcriptional regulator/DNA-binding MarR family transcriptional regulator